MNLLRVLFDLMSMSIPVPHEGHLTSPLLGDLAPRSVYTLVREDHARYEPGSIYSSSSARNARSSRAELPATWQLAGLGAGVRRAPVRPGISARIPLAFL